MSFYSLITIDLNFRSVKILLLCVYLFCLLNLIAVLDLWSFEVKRSNFRSGAQPTHVSRLPVCISCWSRCFVAKCCWPRGYLFLYQNSYDMVPSFMRFDLRHKSIVCRHEDPIMKGLGSIEGCHYSAKSGNWRCFHKTKRHPVGNI